MKVEIIYKQLINLVLQQTLEDDIIVLMNEENQPRVRPVHHTNSRKHTKIPLAPPPNYSRNRSISQPDQQQFLTNLPDHYIDKRPPNTVYTPMPIVIPPTPPPPQQQQQQKQPQHVAEPESLASNVSRPNSRANTSSPSSLRKSSGSYSIYSTFGGESVYSIDATSAKVGSPYPSPSPSPTPPPPLSDNNKEWQHSNHSVADESECSFSTVVSTNDDDDEEEDHTVTDNESSENDDDDDDDDFVDASGFSQEDIEKERKSMMIDSSAKNLSKRLSGGHFGSAGGLVLSIHGAEDEAPPVPSNNATKRKSQKLPADDELAKSMLNWKRHSDSNKRWSMRSHSALVEEMAIDDAAAVKEEKHTSTITVIDLRAELPHLQASNKVEVDTKTDEEELSEPDKLALRKEAEEALSRATPTIEIVPRSPSPTFSSPTSPLLKTLSSETKSSLTSEFSKTFDDVWKTSNDTLQLFDDPKVRLLQTSIQNSAENHKEELERDQVDESVKQAATSLWNEDETVVGKEKMAEWLGQG